MNHVKDMPVDIEELRLWANGYREEKGLSWAKFAREIGMPAGTLQPWCSGTYEGRSDLKAIDVFKFRQTVESREERQSAIPVNPGYFETDTALRIRTLLNMAHMGRITLVATGPGTGKDMAVADYAERASGVIIATMTASTAKLPGMIQQVQSAMRMEVRYHNSASSASRAVVARLRGSRKLLVINEAQHLTVEALEEIRAWHDETGIGICIMGNKELEDRITSGRRSDLYARLNSRIAHRHQQDVPTANDVRAFCDAWNLRDPAMGKFLENIALTIGSGGLRECRMIVEAGCIIAQSEERGLTIADLRDAHLSRATRWIIA